jgi:raffinose/stachyose/melibiose transport system permease protein
MAGRKKIKENNKLKPSQIVSYVFLIIASLYTLAPLYFLLANSFKSQSEIVRDSMALPKSLDFSFLKTAIEKINFGKSLLVTIAITFFSLALIVVVSSLAGWILVRNKSKLSGFFFFLFVGAMLIPFQAIMYPLIKFMEDLGLKTAPGLVIMYGGFGVSLSIFLYHGFIKNVPQAIEEAALIDGANIFQLFFGIVFPLLKSITVTIIILNGMWIWNDYLLPFLTVGNSDKVKTLTLELYFAKILSGQYGNPWELIFPAVLISIIPIIAVFLSLQKYFVKGISEGAIKT